MSASRRLSSLLLSLSLVGTACTSVARTPDATPRPDPGKVVVAPRPAPELDRAAVRHGANGAGDDRRVGLDAGHRAAIRASGEDGERQRSRAAPTDSPRSHLHGGHQSAISLARNTHTSMHHGRNTVNRR